MFVQYLCVEVSQIQGDFSFSLQHSTPIYVDIVRSLPRIQDPEREHQTSSPQRVSAAAGPVVLNAAAIMYFFFPQANRAKALCLCLIHVIKVSPANYTDIAQAAL